MNTKVLDERIAKGDDVLCGSGYGLKLSFYKKADLQAALKTASNWLINAQQIDDDLTNYIKDGQKFDDMQFGEFEGYGLQCFIWDLDEPDDLKEAVNQLYNELKSYSDYIFIVGDDADPTKELYSLNDSNLYSAMQEVKNKDRKLYRQVGQLYNEIGS